MKPPIQISPSVLSADFSRLSEEIASLETCGCDLLHLDVMDGHYVPNLTFGPMLVKAIRKLTDMELEAHLMISEPDKYIESFVKAGADLVLIHPDTSGDVRASLELIKGLGAKCGLVVNPDETLSLVEPYLDLMDQMLIMSVYPGFGGQAFIPEVLAGLPAVLPQFQEANVIVEIDGGINEKTLPGLKGSGIQRFVAGSAVFNSKGTPAQNYLNLSRSFN